MADRRAVAPLISLVKYGKGWQSVRERILHARGPLCACSCAPHQRSRHRAAICAATRSCSRDPNNVPLQPGRRRSRGRCAADRAGRRRSARHKARCTTIYSMPEMSSSASGRLKQKTPPVAKTSASTSKRQHQYRDRGERSFLRRRARDSRAADPRTAATIGTQRRNVCMKSRGHPPERRANRRDVCARLTSSE